MLMLDMDHAYQAAHLKALSFFKKRDQVTKFETFNILSAKQMQIQRPGITAPNGPSPAPS